MVSLSCNRLDVFSTSDALPHLQRVTHSINSGSQMAIYFSSFAANCMFFPVCTMFDVFFGGCKGLNSCLCLKRVTHSNVNPSLRFPRDNTICAIWRCITSKHIYSRRAHFISKTSKTIYLFYLFIYFKNIYQTIYSSLQWISEAEVVSTQIITFFIQVPRKLSLSTKRNTNSSTISTNLRTRSLICGSDLR